MRHITWYFSRLSGFKFHRKLAPKKTQQFTYKGIKHNGIQNNLWGSTESGVNFLLYFFFYFLFVIIPTFCPSPWRLLDATASMVRFWNTVSYTYGQDTVATAAILSLILWAGRFFFCRSFVWDGYWRIRSAVVSPLSRTPLAFSHPIFLKFSYCFSAAVVLIILILFCHPHFPPSS